VINVSVSVFQGIDSFGWYSNLHTIIYKSQPNSLITLTFQSHHETFIRRSWYSVLDVTINCHQENGRRTEYQLFPMKVS